MSALLALAGRALADPTSPSGLAPPEDVDCEPSCEGDGETNADGAAQVGADTGAAQAGADTGDTADVRELVELEDVDSDDTLDDETARSALDAGASFVEDSLAATSGLIDATSLHDLGARHQRPSRWGRVDLAVVWRRVDYDEPSEPSRRHELLLVATWRN